MTRAGNRGYAKVHKDFAPTSAFNGQCAFGIVSQ